VEKPKRVSFMFWRGEWAGLTFRLVVIGLGSAGGAVRSSVWYLILVEILFPEMGFIL